MRRHLHFLLFSLLCLSYSCTDGEDDLVVEGMRPVYVSAEEVRDISFDGPQAISKAGKIYVKGQMLYINDLARGIHIFDNSDPANPVAKAFINIPRNFDIAIKGNTLYADNGPDLIALNISDPENVSLSKRIENAYSDDLVAFPPEYEGYFECVDASQGIVLEWESAMLTNPECRR